MKKISIIFCFYLLVGCVNEEDYSVNKSPSSTDSRINFVLDAVGKEQQLSFSLLTNKEKSILWERKLTKQAESETYDDQQLLLINELIYGAKVHLGNQYALDSFRDSWLKKAKILLSNEQIVSLAYSISPTSAPVPKDCNCNKGSFYSCGLLDPHAYCPDEPTSCENWTPTGCGFLGMYACNGVCKRVY